MNLIDHLTESDIVPIICETLAADIVLMDYGYSENVFKFACNEY